MLSFEYLKLVILPFGKSIYQTSRGQGIGSDTAFLIRTVLEEEKEQEESVLDLGSGNGIISIMLKHYRGLWQITGIEIQEKLVELARENSSMSQEEVEFIHYDLREYKNAGGYSLIVSNPPYYPQDQGRISPVYERAVSRHEILCSLEDIIEFLSRNLRSEGRAYFVHLIERHKEIKELSQMVNMELDKIYSDISCQKKRIQIYRIQK